jgi:hypothetical protein
MGCSVGPAMGLTPSSGAILENLPLVHLVQKFTTFTRPGGSLPSSQNPIHSINGLTTRYRNRNQLMDEIKTTCRHILCRSHHNSEAAQYTIL